MLSVPKSGKRVEIEQPQLNTGLLFLISSSVSFGLCIQFIVVTTIRVCIVRLNLSRLMPWRFALDHVKRLLQPWSICSVVNKIEEKAWRPLYLSLYPKLTNLAMNGLAALANKCAE